jgi:DNA-binding GntR family transcriptional regulator
MVGDHQTSERVYLSLKVDILSSRRTTDRLNINALAHKYEASATPVREALLRLVGEGLVDMPGTGGFVLRQVDGAFARDCYRFGLDLALACVRHAHGSHTPDLTSSRLRYPIDALLIALASRAGNEAMLAATARLNDQMHPIRMMEERRMTGLAVEFEGLLKACAAEEATSLPRALRAYYHRRQRQIGRILGDEP